MPVYKRNVNSLAKSGSSKLKGDVTLSEGTGVTLTQSGQDISIAASGGSGSGDMEASTYDPNSIAADAFSMDNMEQGTTNKYVTVAELTVLGNTSGTNTGDQTTITGNAGTATKLATARAINGVNFDGSAAITVPSIVWSTKTASATAAVNNGYICNAATLVTMTLPSTAAVGTMIEIAGKGLGGWKVGQPASCTINFGDFVTTTGTSGSLASTNQYDTLRLLCITANTTWLVLSSVGNITVV